EALKDEDSGVRWRAAKALGEIKSPEAVKPLMEALKDEDYDVRWRAALALGEIESPQAVKPLIEALQDEDSYVKWRAAEVLEKFADPKILSLLLREWQKDLDEDTLRYLIECISGMDRKLRQEKQIFATYPKDRTRY
ncbi:MAG: HEAT repeat domain-containing protein, partial [candidate division Zixibacteria bacterium]|nr:HEAT repeat domain-containing protein [candidate division Zixibacteria bacterium]